MPLVRPAERFTHDHAHVLEPIVAQVLDACGDGVSGALDVVDLHHGGDLALTDLLGLDPGRGDVRRGQESEGASDQSPGHGTHLRVSCVYPDAMPGTGGEQYLFSRAHDLPPWLPPLLSLWSLRICLTRSRTSFSRSPSVVRHGSAIRSAAVTVTRCVI